MICIIKHNPDGEIVDWIVATDLADATRKAYSAGEQELADELYGRPDFPPGRHELAALGPGGETYTALVS